MGFEIVEARGQRGEALRSEGAEIDVGCCGGGDALVVRGPA